MRTFSALILSEIFITTPLNPICLPSRIIGAMRISEGNVLLSFLKAVNSLLSGFSPLSLSVEFLMALSLSSGITISKALSPFFKSSSVYPKFL